MAALKASELKYGTSLRVAVGDLFLTATRVEIPSGKEYEVGTLVLDKTKLGLTVQAVAGADSAAAAEGVAPTAGEAATTTALPAFVWCTNLTAAKTDAEEAKEVTEGYLTQVSLVGSKLIARIFGVTTAGDGKPINEAKTATKITFTAAQAFTVFVLGK